MITEAARKRKERGVPFSSLDIRDRPGRKDAAGYLAGLKKVVEDVRVWECGELPKRWTTNELLGVWEGAGYRGPVSAECHRSERG